MLGLLPESQLNPMESHVNCKHWVKMQPGVKYLEVGLDKYLVLGMFDTGANVSIISSHLAR